ncbi:MAG: hypothetical protein RhofKO_09730 [Rhodothermales bacterium]
MAVLVMLVLVATLAGCGSAKEATSDGPGTPVEVRNRNWRSMEIFVWDRARRVRLGRIKAGGVKSFTVPGYLTAPGTELRFEMESSGQNPDVFSELFVIAPGEAIILVIPNSR